MIPAPVATQLPAQTPTRTIVFVWDGLRPDDVTQGDTPNLYAMQTAGVNFTDNHSTFTMMNGSSFATRSFPGKTGFYGNTFWTPPPGGNATPAGNNAGGTAQDYVSPVFTEDHQVLTTLNNYHSGQLLLKILFATAQAAGMTTAAIGKSGAAHIEDVGGDSLFVDENTVQLRGLVTELHCANIPITANTVYNYSGSNAVTLAAGNGSPTARPGYVTSNPTAMAPNGPAVNGATGGASAVEPALSAQAQIRLGDPSKAGRVHLVQDAARSYCPLTPAYRALVLPCLRASSR